MSLCPDCRSEADMATAALGKGDPDKDRVCDNCGKEF